MTDDSGAVVVGAKVTVRNVQTGVTNETSTTDAVNYQFPSPIRDSYEMTVELAGFK